MFGSHLQIFERDEIDNPLQCIHVSALLGGRV
jgi:hypothetical protein